MIALAALALALPQTPTSQDSSFSYTYLDVRFDYVDFEGGDDVGFTLEGAYDLFPNVFVLGEYQRLTEDANLDTVLLGAGYQLPIASRTDFTGDAALLHTESGSEDEEGFRLRAGVRHQLTDPLELDAYLIHLNVDSDADTGIKLGGLYRWSQTSPLRIVGSYTRFDNDTDLFDVGVRLDF